MILLNDSTKTLFRCNNNPGSKGSFTPGVQETMNTMFFHVKWPDSLIVYCALDDKEVLQIAR